MIRIYGVPFSAHTRKVLVGLREKRLPFELVPLVPLVPDLPAEFVAASPLRKIPVLFDGDRPVTDSTVIALYLDRVYPERPLYPVDAGRYATALFVEEMVDGSLAPSVLHGLLYQRVIGPVFEPGFVADERALAAALANIPARLRNLEERLTGEWFAGEFSYADVTVASILVNLHFSGERLDERTFPRLADHLDRCLGRPSFADGLAAEVATAAKVPGMAMDWLRGKLAAL